MSDDLGVRIPLGQYALAYQYGLISEHRYLMVGQLRLPIALPQYRSRRLPEGVARGALHSIGHNIAGMKMGAASEIGLIALALVTKSGAFVALACVLAMFLVSVVVHEAGHVVAYRLFSTAGPGYLVRSGVRCYLIRPVLPRIADRWVIAAGPIAPLAVAILCIPVMLYAPIPYLAWLAIALGHALTLALPAGDGANFWGTYPNLVSASRQIDA